MLHAPVIGEVVGAKLGRKEGDGLVCPLQGRQFYGCEQSSMPAGAGEWELHSKPLGIQRNAPCAERAGGFTQTYLKITPREGSAKEDGGTGVERSKALGDIEALAL